MIAEPDDDDHRAEVERLLRGADEIIAAGFPAMIFVVWPKGDGTLRKAPAHLHGHLDATTDRQAFLRAAGDPHLPQGVPADHELLVGFVPGPGGALVLDCDAKDNKPGVAWLQGASAKYPTLLDAVWRSPSGGLNVLVDKIDAAIHVGSGQVWEGVDVCGDGRGVVAPGQASRYGGAWAWGEGSSYATRSTLPADLAGGLSTGAPPGYTAPSSGVDLAAYVKATAGRTTAHTLELLAVRLGKLTASGRGSRHDALVSVVGWLFGMRHLDLEHAMTLVCSTWDALTPGERRDGEPWEVARWVVAQEAHKTPPPNVDPETGEIIDRPTFEPWRLGPYISGDVVYLTPDLLDLGGGQALLYGSRLNGIHGDSGAGKSWIVALGVREILELGRRVMVVDLEDDPTPLIGRLRQIGVSDEAILDGLVFIHPDGSFRNGGAARLAELCAEYEVAHVFLDSLGEAFALEGIDENNDAEVAPWLSGVVRKLIAATGAGVTLIDHITKLGDNPLHPSGSKRKRAAITGSAWFVYAIDPFDRAKGGRIGIRCAKDRHGSFRRGDTVAELVMSLLDVVTGRSTLELRAAHGDGDGEETGRPRDPLDVLVEALATYGPHNADGLDALMHRVANWGQKYTRGQRDLALIRSLIVEVRGAHNARIFQSVSSSSVLVTDDEHS